MPSESAQAFWSYVHADNHAEGERIARLATDLKREYEMIAAAELELFIDRDAIRWGEDWKRRIDDAVAGAGFFVPIITPRYFQSNECRRELMYFHEQAALTGAEQLLLPILYLDVPELARPDDLTDAPMRLIAHIQRMDWRPIRLLEPESTPYRAGVNAMARRLQAVVQELTAAAQLRVPPQPSDHTTREGRSARRALDREVRAANLDGELSRWRETLDASAPVQSTIHDRVSDALDASHASDYRGDGAPGRVRVAATLAQELQAPAARIADLGLQAAEVLRRIDALVTGPAGTTVDDLPAELYALSESSRSIHASLDAHVARVDRIAKNARVLRPVLRDLQRALQGFADAQAIYDDWLCDDS